MALPQRTVSYRSSQGFVTGSFQAMAGPCEVLIETDDMQLARKVCQTAAQEAWRIETTFSRYRKDNVIYKINHALGESIKVDDETAKLIDFADFCYQSSEGMFDISSGILGKLWKFDGSCNIPEESEVKLLLAMVGWHKVQWNKPLLTMPSGMAIDFGGIGKEYAVDSAAMLVKQLTEAPVLINFGGDIYSTKPPDSRPHWAIGIEPIALGGKQQPKIGLRFGAVATSGDSKRYLTDHGKILSHVLDPNTGWPVEHAAASITVMAENCTQAGMLSTIAMLKGKGAERFLQAQQVKHWIQRR
ncbi:MAG: FAD:protein FMN transferase [Kangiellaceae bacterium]|nr:FAD:protein FMN transferase [Kangiellaceae bacterium]